MKHAEFVMPELKRTNSYEALVYDGDKMLVSHSVSALNEQQSRRICLEYNRIGGDS